MDRVWLDCTSGKSADMTVSTPAKPETPEVTGTAATTRVPGRTDIQLLTSYAETRDPRLREALVERFLPLARSIAKRYRKAEEPFDDLLQVASLGLLKALDRFDPARGIAFSSFAVPTIVGELRRHFRDRCWSVRPPRELQERALEVDKLRTELTSRLGRSPSVREIGQALELDDERVLEALQAQQGMRATSLDAPRPGVDDTDSTLGDATGDVDPELGRAEHRATLARLFNRLDEREQRVLRLRFEEDMTQEQIGRLVGVSQMQVSRIIRGAVGKLSAPPEK
jgi:RNA polymerase sigma-B factor